MDRPALLIDVDGVLCPFGCEDSPEGYEPVAIDAPLGDYVYISARNADRLERLAQTFDLVWATGWEHRANEHLLEHHRLPGPLPVIEFWGKVPGIVQKLSGFYIEDSRFKMAHWKLPWIEAWANRTERPLAWIDDEIDPGTVAWAETRSDQGVPTLALPIPFRSGLGDEHVEKLEEWWHGAETDHGNGA